MSLESKKPISKSEHYQNGFIDLVKDMSDYSAEYYFKTAGNSLAHQHEIQTMSYQFAYGLFGNSKASDNGSGMQIYLAKIDLNDISQGLIDLSNPNLHDKQYSHTDIEKVYSNNDKVLKYLFDPFSSALLNKSLNIEINNLRANLLEKPIELKNKIIINFLTNNHALIREVILFCHVINLMCVSQGLYAFAFQLKKNPNFASLIELILESNFTLNNDENIQKLAERFFSVFIGNLAYRVFSENSLVAIEEAFSAGEIK